MSKLIKLVISLTVFYLNSCKPTEVVNDYPQTFEDAELYLDSIFQEKSLFNKKDSTLLIKFK